MCGIVGYIGNKAAKDILLNGLKSLEYRGYDSAGIALLDEGRINVIKSQGKIASLESKINQLQNVTSTSSNKPEKEFNSILQERLVNAINKSNCGIGHTRWATHGKPSDINSHPHLNTAGNIALVHNGIIKNFYEIKRELEEDGVEFISETDTEVVVKFYSKFKDQGLSDIDAFRKVLQRLDGSYAFALINADSQKIILAKNQSPLVIGIGDNENFIASDSATVLEHTEKVIKLKDLQIAELSANDVKLFDLDGNTVKLEVHHMHQVSSVAEKGPYKHFLLKEIHEQPAVISKMLLDAYSVATEPIACFNNLDFKFSQIDKISFVACGSAYHAALVGKYLIELWAKIPVEVNIASEFCSFPVLHGKNNLVIGISQSGETADTIAAIKSAQSAGAKIMAITNKQDSAIFDLAKPNTYVTPAGIEVSVASTKAFTSQVLALYLLAIKAAEDKGLDLIDIKDELHKLPLVIDQVIERADDYHAPFLKYANYRDFLFLSRGVNYPIALEGALKLKELSYIHATGYPSGEMKHGPIAILDQNVPVLSIAIDGASELEHNVYKKTLSNAEEARARMSPSLVIACDSNRDVENIFDEIIRIPNISQFFSPIIATIPLQFLAYYIAEHLGKDVDQPRNLAKSVTVE
ncbi:MAG: glutamine--fructose-6-phosphate transaminase (isomerizing) [Candidatus Caenarcaniphilales bacterium]|jgi:glucosamine--fructose-6-phosphate aminotransferase (isomerizing)|nr:glutamine--fructose-6-phosphate transaminase (isomerizing) [Candidatus Caenarcaniphilales bacterium]